LGAGQGWIKPNEKRIEIIISSRSRGPPGGEFAQFRISTTLALIGSA
jgi:hypothetical protein